VLKKKSGCVDSQEKLINQVLLLVEMGLDVEEMAVFCKKKGFVFQSAEIYGGLSGFFDYGPLGVELKNNLRQSWYKFIVRDRSNVVAQDGSIITNSKVWQAAGHLDNFADIVLVTKKSKTRLRADHFIEENLSISAEGLGAKDISELIKKHKLNYKGEEFEEVKDFHLMFSTYVGAEEGVVGYLRPETCQSIFPNFKLIMDSSRQKLPFGIAQMGKAFRNEISPRDFLFRQREFEQMELEFFINPKDKTCRELSDKHKNVKLRFLSGIAQEEKKDMEEVSLGSLLEKENFSEWHAYWLAEMYLWYVEVLGIKPENLRVREHTQKELSHYSTATFDIDYKFPFGYKEVLGIANRGQYDLKKHMEHSGEKLEVFDEVTSQKVLPTVIEPSQGLDRLFLAIMFEAYEANEERGNVVLKLDGKLSPYYCAVFPLVRNKPELVAKSEEVYDLLRKEFSCFWDEGGSVGRRYARADEIGIRWCVTVDFEALEDGCVTIRDRDTTKQMRVKISELQKKLDSLSEI
jgi:glycyl-tRNA synthetase